MTKTKMYLLATTLSVITTTALVATFSFAAETNSNQTTPFGPPEHRQEMKAEMQTIFENNDYDAWTALMQERVTQMRQQADELAAKITPENFAKLIEAHQLINDSKIKEAKTILEELGLGGPHPGFRGMMRQKSTE